MTILDEILEHKRAELREARRRVPDREVAARAEAAEPARGLRRALESAEPPAIVAELKRRSPSRGEMRADYDPARLAKEYAEGGAAALSVLTDERFFGGRLGHLRAVRGAVELPLLRKDFVIDPYQVDEARAAGADAVLLIVAALGGSALRDLAARARARGLDALVEVHDERELDLALAAGAELVGVNNRDLRSFATDLAVTERLAPRVPPGVLVVAESGIAGSADLERLARAGARAFLVGESLMREPEPGRALRRLRLAEGSRGST
jgi:indole-3-glycerol phosphate synthase